MEKISQKEFIITKHAQQRIKERFKCVDSKVMKVVRKAWQNQTPITKEFILVKKQKVYAELSGDTTHYRIFQGYLFVFIESSLGIKRLITIYKKPETRLLKRLPRFSSGHFNSSAPKRWSSIKVDKK
jgi:hypothetical protein